MIKLMLPLKCDSVFYSVKIAVIAENKHLLVNDCYDGTDGIF